METEMTAWKAKLYDVMRKVDTLGSAEKENVLVYITDLNMLLEEMSERVERLKTECPSDWSPMKSELRRAAWTCEAGTKKPWRISERRHRYRFRDSETMGMMNNYSPKG